MEWRAVEGWPYEVSDHGLVARSAPGQRTRVGRIRKPVLMNNGYLAVDISRNGRRRIFHIHRLVASAFLVKPSGFDVVNHIDGNPLNNCSDNLEWTTPAGNAHHAAQNGLCAAGGSNGNSKLTEADVLAIRREFAADESRGSRGRIAKRYGVTPQNVAYIVRGVTWKHVLPAKGTTDV